MSMDYLSLGSVPCGEQCAQLGADDYSVKMRRESRAYIGQLERLFPALPDGVYFRNKSFTHDFGTYHEVCIFFDADDADACDAAYNVENNLPEQWDAAAQLVLNPLAEQLKRDLSSGVNSTYDRDNRLIIS